jgi:hypothetical protein
MKLQSLHGGCIVNVRDLGITIRWPVKFSFRPLYPPEKPLARTEYDDVRTSEPFWKWRWRKTSQQPYGDLSTAVQLAAGCLTDSVPNHIYSIVGIATGYGLDDRGLGVRVFSTSSKPALGSTQPPIQWTPMALSQGVKRSGCEADHTHTRTTSAEVKKMWIYTSTSSYALWCSA